MNEAAIEQRIVDLGLTAPRVTPVMIEELLKGVTYSTHIIPGTTTVLASAIMPSGFVICTIQHPSGSPESFKPALAIEIAINKAAAAAREKLYEFEGYRIKQALHEVRTERASQASAQIRAVLSRGLPA